VYIIKTCLFSFSFSREIIINVLYLLKSCAKTNHKLYCKKSILSLKELVNKGWEIIFKKDIALLCSKIDTSLKVIAKWDKNAYYFTNITIDDNKLEKVVYNTTNNNLDLIYKRLNHLSKDYLIKTLQNIKGFNRYI
jgi:hypothetical protein